jgi:hypothetical protein
MKIIDLSIFAAALMVALGTVKLIKTGSMDNMTVGLPHT